MDGGVGDVDKEALALALLLPQLAGISVAPCFFFGSGGQGGPSECPRGTENATGGEALPPTELGSPRLHASCTTLTEHFPEDGHFVCVCVCVRLA